jgi:hypothetical protein
LDGQRFTTIPHFHEFLDILHRRGFINRVEVIFRDSPTQIGELKVPEVNHEANLLFSKAFCLSGSSSISILRLLVSKTVSSFEMAIDASGEIPMTALETSESLSIAALIFAISNPI